LRSIDTARRPPPDVPLGYPGLLGPGETWLYLASDSAEGVPVEVDGRPFPRPHPVAVSATAGHDVRFEGGPTVHVRWIPCTTAVVRFHGARRDASVNRYYNGATCL